MPLFLNDGFENSNSAIGPSLTFESAIGKKFIGANVGYKF